MMNISLKPNKLIYGQGRCNHIDHTQVYYWNISNKIESISHKCRIRRTLTIHLIPNGSISKVKLTDSTTIPKLKWNKLGMFIVCTRQDGDMKSSNRSECHSHRFDSPSGMYFTAWSFLLFIQLNSILITFWLLASA